MSLIVDAESATELIDQLVFHIADTGKPYLERLREVIRWSSRGTASKQLAQVVGSGMSRPAEVSSALNYIKRLTESRHRPAPGQSKAFEADLDVYFKWVSVLYGESLWDAAEEALEDYLMVFPEEGDKLICAHPRSTCECGIIHPRSMAKAYCEECGLPRKICRARAMLNGRCVDHGGSLPEGMSKGSLYRQNMDPDMADAHGRIEAEGNLSLASEIGLVATNLAQLINKSSATDPKKIRELQKRLDNALKDDDADKLFAAATELQQAMSDGGGGQSGDEIRKWLIVLSTLTQQERENRKTAAEYIHMDEYAREKDSLLLDLRVGMDRSYATMRRLTMQYIIEAMSRNPGDDPANIANVVASRLLDSQRMIEAEVMAPSQERQPLDISF
jgi:hypothetical protein